MSLSTLGITVVIFSLIIAGLVYLVDVNRHKDKIVAALMAHTGRAFQVQDRIRFTLLPWAGMNLGKIRVGNAQGFEGTDFANIHGVKVRVKVMPMLAGRIIVDTVRLEGVDVNLIRDSDGVTNWDDLIRLANQAITPEQRLVTQPTEKKKKKPSAKKPQLPIDLEKLNILGVEVKALNLTFEDHLTHSLFKLDGLNVKTSDIRLNHPVSVQVKASVIARNVPAMDGLAFDSEVHFETKLTMLVQKSLDVASLPGS
ncbi:MAG: AsmA family protein [Thiohalocapsa sp.]